MSHWPIRVTGSLLIIAALFYSPWMFANLNTHALWLAIPFAMANFLLIITLFITVFNNWKRSSPPTRLVAEGEERTVAVIVPTYGEPSIMVMRTVRSILRQRWPIHRLNVIISDDSHSPHIQTVTEVLQREFRQALILYHEPPLRSSPQRRGEAKAGNLNSALELIKQYWGDVEYIETRDADDEVGDRDFLRHCIGQLQANDKVAYVQTIKEARVSAGDPFANQNGVFYRGAMLARNAANAVVPCGSGLVWRKQALLDIGGFPTWNLVEDLQSGLEALLRGWLGLYVPIVGAIGQTAPEDIPNVYKQSGTWALDTMRLFFWGDVRGLTFRQRLHFIELGLFYLQSFTVVIILGTLSASFWARLYPLTTDSLSYALHFWPFALAVELFLATLNGRQRYEALLRQREMWMGLTPVFLKACFTALWNGPRRKPVYQVTRKSKKFAWYWRETLPQMFLLLLIVSSLIYSVFTTPLLTSFDVGSAYWVLFYGTFLVGFIRKSWFGVRRRSSAKETLAETEYVQVFKELVTAPPVPSAETREAPQR